MVAFIISSARPIYEIVSIGQKGLDGLFGIPFLRGPPEKIFPRPNDGGKFDMLNI